MRDGNSHSDLLASPEALALVQQAVSDSLLVVASCGADSDWAEDVCEVADGCYGLSGTTGPFNSTRDAYAVKVDPLGNIIWQFNYGDTSPYREDYGTRASALADTGMVATGWRTDQIHSDPRQSAFLSLDPAAPPNAAQIITPRHPDSADVKNEDFTKPPIRFPTTSGLTSSPRGRHRGTSTKSSNDRHREFQ